MTKPDLKISGGSAGFEIRNVDSSGKSVELWIYDIIGPDSYGMIGGQTIVNALKPYNALDTIFVRINSVGGSIVEGMAIYNTLTRHPARKVVSIDGLAASTAGFVAMAGDEINMAENALFMLHDPTTIMAGTSKELRDTADVIDKSKANIVKTYAARSGQDAASIAQMMTDETWLEAGDALTKGFITKITPAKKIAAIADLSIFKNAPANVAARFSIPQPAGANAAEKSKDEVMPISKEQFLEFANANPDAIKPFNDAGHAAGLAAGKADVQNLVNAARVAATDEATKLERERCVALANAFKDDGDFLAKQIGAGHDVPKAKVERYDAMAAENADLKTRPAGQDGTKPAGAKPLKNDAAGDDVLVNAMKAKFAKTA